MGKKETVMGQSLLISVIGDGGFFRNPPSPFKFIHKMWKTMWISMWTDI